MTEFTNLQRLCGWMRDDFPGNPGMKIYLPDSLYMACLKQYYDYTKIKGEINFGTFELELSGIKIYSNEQHT